MSSGEIEANCLWKKFKRGRHHDSLRDFIPALARGLFPPKVDRSEAGVQEFWAVRDVSFRVKAGDTLAIIGHNGAGKSTLLKLLTRVLRPTRGRCRVTGRLGALVEIAAGFHPDLTGRENVHLQGAILGMSRKDLLARFDAIVDFSGISEFIDTPVKRYSTGMMARLGFSIAAHIDPDVMIIDEILSVGDLSFQTQAFGRIRELATSGRPVVVVSHQLPMVEELCRRAIILEHGAVVYEGPAREGVATYVNGVGQRARHVPGNSPVRIDSVIVKNGDLLRSGDFVRLTVQGQIEACVLPDHVEPVGIVMRNPSNGALLSVTGTQDCGVQFTSAGPFSLDVVLQLNVPPSVYALEAVCWDKKRMAAISVGPAVSVRVHEGTPFMGLVQLNARMEHSPRGDSKPRHLVLAT